MTVLDDPLLTARQSAAEGNISLPAFWKGVAEGRLPAPLDVFLGAQVAFVRTALGFRIKAHVARRGEAGAPRKRLLPLANPLTAIEPLQGPALA